MYIKRKDALTLTTIGYSYKQIYGRTFYFTEFYLTEVKIKEWRTVN